jgi:ribonuclease Y
MDVTNILLGGLVGIIAGGGVTFALQATALKARREKMLKDAENEGESMKKEKMKPFSLVIPFS